MQIRLRGEGGESATGAWEAVAELIGEDVVTRSALLCVVGQAG